MESIQQQISALTQKVDQIYQIVGRLQQHVDLDLAAPIGGGEETSIRHPHNREDALRINASHRRSRHDSNSSNQNGQVDLVGGSNYYHDTPDWIIAQQDILIDSSGVEISHHQIKEQDLAPQVQIQRLTAQLTAAYNRIAALEEQLLAKRWK